MSDADWSASPGPAAEAVLDELVERFNARDLEGLAELLAPELISEFLQAGSPEELLASLADLWMREPSLTLTRGERGYEPVAAAWVADGHAYRFLGYFEAAFREVGGGEVLLDRLELVEDDERDDSLLLEELDPDEMAEWELEA